MLKNLILLTFFLLQGPAIFAQEWITDFGQAKERASATDVTILLVFQGSDWCAPCIKLEQEIWSANGFKDYAKDHFIMLQADFPRRKKNELSQEQQNHNNALAEKYNPNGIFPLVVILDSSGSFLGETGYKKLSPEEYIQHINSFIP